MSITDRIQQIKTGSVGATGVRVLLVEGVDDVAAFRIFLSHRPQAADWERHWHLEPAGNKRHVMAMLKHEPTWLGIVDRDELTPADCTAAALTQSNLVFLPRFCLESYLADKFFKDHLQTYKKRPIYWLFSSGKQGAFQALVYLHRYNEGTLARMRAEYVVPLIAKMVSRLEMLSQDVAAASSAAARTKLQKQIESLRKKQIELLAYDEKLRHYADMRITLDLDDGVKLNYAKFGDLVAESKAITGGSDD